MSAHYGFALAMSYRVPPHLPSYLYNWLYSCTTGDPPPLNVTVTMFGSLLGLFCLSPAFHFILFPFAVCCFTGRQRFTMRLINVAKAPVIIMSSNLTIKRWWRPDSVCQSFCDPQYVCSYRLTKMNPDARSVSGSWPSCVYNRPIFFQRLLPVRAAGLPKKTSRVWDFYRPGAIPVTQPTVLKHWMI